MNSFIYSVWLFRLAFIGFFLSIGGSINHNTYVFALGVILEVLFLSMAVIKRPRKDITWSHFFGKKDEKC